MDESLFVNAAPLSTWTAPSCHDESCMTDLDHAFLSEVKALLDSQPPAPTMADLRLNPPELSDTSTLDDATSNCSGSVPISPTGTKAAEQKKPIRKRRGRKCELEMLRAKVDDLQGRLELLRREEVKATAQVLGSALIGSALPPAMRMIILGTSVNDAQTKEALERGALVPVNETDRREREEMKQLVLENVRLRTLVDAQLAISKNLGSVYQKQKSSGESTFMIDPSSPFASPIYESIRSSINARYPFVDATLEECGLAGSDELINRKGQLRHITGGMFYESVDCRVLPFNRNDIVRVLWCCMGMETGHSSMNQLRETSDDMIHSRSRHKLLISKSETTATTYMVLKRFDEHDRILLLWEQYVETEGTLALKLKGKGVYVLRSPLNGDGSDRATVTQSYLVQMTPESDEMESYQVDCDLALQDLTKVVLSSYYCNLDIVQHVIETVLLPEIEKSRQ